MAKVFSNREVCFLVVFALAGLLSYFSGFDYYLAGALGSRAAHGVSLFFSYWYFAAYMVTAFVVLLLKDRRAAGALVFSIIAVFLMQHAFTLYAPRARPPEALPIGSPLMALIYYSGTSSSFFSGHTASVVAVFAVFALVGYHPTIVLALGIPIITSRITLVQHYLSDIFGGIIFGYVTAKAVFWWFKGR